MSKFLGFVSFLPILRNVRSLSGVASETSTIYALSSGKGKSGIAVVRISGSETSSILSQLTKRPNPPSPRLASLRTIHDPMNDEKLDKGLVLWFPGPNSFTGEDLAELHIHGGHAVVQSTLNALSRFPRTRQAEPGEFTKRSFLNGKIDLTEAEGVADIIHAETEAQRRQAFRQMNGSLSQKYSGWRKKLLKVRAFLEAFIDFGEEEQLEPDMLNQVKEMILSIENELKNYLNDHRRGERLRNGVHITIVGEPNVGKSSLLNSLCQKPAAIVSPIAGTTRDVVESAFDLGGYPILLSDTAGFRKTENFVENEGIRRALAKADESDLVILVVDVCDFSSLEFLPSIDDLISSRLSTFGFTLNPDQKIFFVFNKIDLVPENSLRILRKKICEKKNLEKKNSEIYFSSEKKTFSEKNVHFLSCTTDSGMMELVAELTAAVRDLCGNPLIGDATLTQQRHRSQLESCLSRLANFWERLADDDVTLATYEIQQALRCIGKITGQVYVEEVLDVIFRDFCIGK